MICGLAAHGLAKEALSHFSNFIRGFLPRNVTFVGVLNACSQAGLVDDGRHYFKLMTQLYLLEPEMEDYGCMVDLLARAGLVHEALDFVENMANKPDPMLWATLLGACKIHGLVELRETIEKKLIKLDPTHDGNYVLLSSIHPQSRKWDDVLRLVDVGYSLDVSPMLHDIGEDEKENAIWEHSERLTIAFGLLVARDKSLPKSRCSLPPLLCSRAYTVSESAIRKKKWDRSCEAGTEATAQVSIFARNVFTIYSNFTLYTVSKSVIRKKKWDRSCEAGSEAIAQVSMFSQSSLLFSAFQSVRTAFTSSPLNLIMPKKRGRPRSRDIDEDKHNNVSEDYCFECKDGGELILCDFKNCNKAYHLECVGKDPTLPDAADHWICNWHVCFICKRSSKYRCHCCTNAVCKTCLIDAHFVHVSGEKGFCNNCLKLALLSEENLDVDSDGGKVDFEDRDTVEFLFKDYWEIIKVQEGLTLDILRKAKIELKEAENHKNKFVEGDEDYNFSDDMDEKWDDQNASMKEYGRSSTRRSKKKPKKIEFIGWASKNLIQFLSSIDKDTSKSFSQYEVNDMIKTYINENQLVHPEKKKKVLCDERLKKLFGRKSVNRNKIYDLLEPHFAINEDQSEDESSNESEEESLRAQKRQRKISIDGSAYKAKRVKQPPQSRFAQMSVKNIKLVYLKKSLIEDLLKTPDTFNDKVLGSFVRIKPDLRNFVLRNTYLIGQVTVLWTSSLKLNPEPVAVDSFVIVPRTLNPKLVAVDSFQILIKEVFLQVRNVKKDVPISMLSDNDLTEAIPEECDDLQKKMKDGVLEKITIAIEEELALLENLIDQANEKGWRREYPFPIRALLKKPEERTRLLQLVPMVIPEEVEIETLPDSPEENSREHELKEMLYKETETLHVFQEEKSIPSNFVVIPDAAGDNGVCHPKAGKTENEGLVTSSPTTDLKEKELGEPLQDELRGNEETNDKDKKLVKDGAPYDPKNCVWHYVDPFGDVQGPFSMEMLEKWHGGNYFSPDFKVWKTGQSQEAPVLLTDALALTFKKAKKRFPHIITSGIDVENLISELRVFLFLFNFL
ncbi:hypothetical protein Sjap_006638 [Stephania japonica]|uniref:Uncharacterized protein n=1 Tax=Stephania japonica TaxID=461633 RepID=A0AAP0K7D6_9MAGN